MQRQLLIWASAAMTACGTRASKPPAPSLPVPAELSPQSMPVATPPPPRVDFEATAPERIVVRTHCDDGRPVLTDGVCKRPSSYWKPVCHDEATCSRLCDAGRACRALHRRLRYRCAPGRNITMSGATRPR